MTSITSGRPLNRAVSTGPVLPVMPIAVRVLPGIGLGVRLCLRAASQTRVIDCCGASVFMTTSMGLTPGCLLQRSGEFGPRFAVANCIDETAGDDHAVGQPVQRLDVLRGGDAEADDDGRVGDGADAFEERRQLR